MDFEYLRLSGIVESHYPLHNGDLIDRIQKSYEKYKYKLMFGMLTGRYDKYMEPINMIKNYYGELCLSNSFSHSLHGLADDSIFS